MKPYLILRRLFTVIVVLFVVTPLFSQQPEKQEEHKKKKHFEPNSAILFAPVYTAQFPFGDMQDRYGFNSLFGFAIHYKTKKNWLVGLEGNFLFGTTVRQGYVLDNISTATGQFVSQNNDLVRINPQEQGANVKFNFGKIIPFSEKFPDAGLLIMTGAGLLQHKMIFDVKKESLPQLDKTYRKGYDRMCLGPVFSQFIGGIFLERRRFISVYGGLQFDIGYTQNMRPYDFYSRAKLTEKRLDMFLGIKVGWIIPYFLQTSSKEYYYY